MIKNCWQIGIEVTFLTLTYLQKNQTKNHFKCQNIKTSFPLLSHLFNNVVSLSPCGTTKMKSWGLRRKKKVTIHRWPSALKESTKKLLELIRIFKGEYNQYTKVSCIVMQHQFIKIHFKPLKRCSWPRQGWECRIGQWLCKGEAGGVMRIDRKENWDGFEYSFPWQVIIACWL